MNNVADIPEGEADTQTKPGKPKPAKVLPTDRLTFDKQLSIGRAYGAASGPERNATSNAEVAKIAEVSTSSISMCNPFFIELGWIMREGMKQRPTQALADYCSAWEWNKDTAGIKLAPTLAQSWFAKALLPKLSFRSHTVDEAVAVLADDAKAVPDYKDNLVLLLEYLKVGGLIALEGNTVSKATTRPYENQQQEQTPPPPKKNIEVAADVERFEIPLPGKPSAVVIVPKDLNADDWEMLTAMMAIYVKRWKSEIFK